MLFKTFKHYIFVYHHIYFFSHLLDLLLCLISDTMLTLKKNVPRGLLYFLRQNMQKNKIKNIHIISPNCHKKMNETLFQDEIMTLIPLKVSILTSKILLAT